MDQYTIFEAIRTNKNNGGTVIGIHKNLKPVLTEEYSGDFELLVVEVNINKGNIRVISGYGPQENVPEPSILHLMQRQKEHI